MTRPFRSTILPFVTIASLALAIYIGGYLAMFNPSGGAAGPMVNPRYTLGPLTRHMNVTAIDLVDRMATCVFTPAHWFHMAVKDDEWNPDPDAL